MARRVGGGVGSVMGFPRVSVCSCWSVSPFYIYKMSPGKAQLYRIAEPHYGFLVFSADTLGSTVSLFPMAKTLVPEPNTSDRSPALQKNYCPVLIVEDDADLREMMSQLIALEGYRAHTVANGREALEYLRREHRPELILLDLMMPVMDGWEFRREQRKDPAIADVPVVVLSALDPSRGADIGAIEFLKKPLDFDRLLALVRQY